MVPKISLLLYQLNALVCVYAWFEPLQQRDQFIPTDHVQQLQAADNFVQQPQSGDDRGSYWKDLRQLFEIGGMNVDVNDPVHAGFRFAPLIASPDAGFDTIPIEPFLSQQPYPHQQQLLQQLLQQQQLQQQQQQRVPVFDGAFQPAAFAHPTDDSWTGRAQVQFQPEPASFAHPLFPLPLANQSEQIWQNVSAQWSPQFQQAPAFPVEDAWRTAHNETAGSFGSPFQPIEASWPSPSAASWPLAETSFGPNMPAVQPTAQSSFAAPTSTVFRVLQPTTRHPTTTIPPNAKFWTNPPSPEELAYQPRVVEPVERRPVAYNIVVSQPKRAAQTLYPGGGDAPSHSFYPPQPHAAWNYGGSPMNHPSQQAPSYWPQQTPQPQWDYGQGLLQDETEPAPDPYAYERYYSKWWSFKEATHGKK